MIKIGQNPVYIRIAKNPFFSNYYTKPLRFFVENIYIFSDNLQLHWDKKREDFIDLPFIIL